MTTAAPAGSVARVYHSHMDVDIAAALCRIPHTACHAEMAPAVPGGRDGSGLICQECARALALELARLSGVELAEWAREAGYREGRESGYEDGWRAALGRRKGEGRA